MMRRREQMQRMGVARHVRRRIVTLVADICTDVMNEQLAGGFVKKERSK